MSRHWKSEPLNNWIGAQSTYFVEVCVFTFRFHSLQNLRETLAFYEKKILPSSRLPDAEMMEEWRTRKIYNGRKQFRRFLSSEHDVVQRWWEKLPLYLRENGKRERVVKALHKALKEWK